MQRKKMQTWISTKCLLTLYKADATSWKVMQGKLYAAAISNLNELGSILLPPSFEMEMHCTKNLIILQPGVDRSSVQLAGEKIVCACAYNALEADNSCPIATRSTILLLGLKIRTLFKKEINDVILP